MAAAARELAAARFGTAAAARKYASIYAEALEVSPGAPAW
jgi:hypothetical protein